MEIKDSHNPCSPLLVGGKGPTPPSWGGSCLRGRGYRVLGLSRSFRPLAEEPIHPLGGGLRAWWGPWFRAPPCHSPARSRGRHKATTLTLAGCAPGRIVVRAPPTRAAHSSNITCPQLPGAPPSALAADDSLPLIAGDLPPGPFSAWAGPNLTVAQSARAKLYIRFGDPGASR